MVRDFVFRLLDTKFPMETVSILLLISISFLFGTFILKRTLYEYNLNSCFCDFISFHSVDSMETTQNKKNGKFPNEDYWLFRVDNFLAELH